MLLYGHSAQVGLQKQSQYPISPKISCVILGESQSSISSVSPTIKGAGGIIFLTFILSMYSVKEAAATLWPGCRKQEREKSRIGAQHSPAKL